MPANLWFKQKYVEPIITGEKTDTLRKPTSKWMPEGTLISLSVGPRTPFALARITACEVVKTRDLSEERRESLRKLIGDSPVCQRLAFEIVHVHGECLEVLKVLTDPERDVTVNEDLLLFAAS